MPCNHKFQENLTLEKLTFLPQKLFVGTFNPQWPESNYAEWFYGRTQNNYFWELLSQLYGVPGLRDKDKTAWKLFCQEHKIAITDLISSIADADEHNPVHQKRLGKYYDSILSSKFKQHEIVNIVALLKQHPTIREVYLTRSTTTGLWNKLWQPVQDYCHEKEIKCVQLITPSKGARYAMRKGSGIRLYDFILGDWQTKIKQ